MKGHDVAEILVTLAILYLLGTVFFDQPTTEELYPEPVYTQQQFDDYPLMAWLSEDRRGQTVKIRYRVDSNNTKIWIYDYETGLLVHEQPFTRDPHSNGIHRDFTYVWKLYQTERTIDIGPGTYEIIVGGKHEPTSLHGGYTILFEF